MSVSDLISAVQSIPKISKVENHNSNLLDAPKWLTQRYLENCLRNYYDDTKLKIENMDSKPALGRGENYGGVMTRIKADYITGEGYSKTGNYIVKSSFETDEFARKTMEPYDIFNREMSIYESLLPKLKDLLHEISDDEQIFAETISVDYDRSTLIFKDLNVSGYIMPNRLEGLDMDLTRIVLRKLAKMHAASAVLNEREGGILEGYDRGMFNRHTNNYAPCFLGLLDACSRRMSQWEGYEAYGKKLADLAPIYMELGKRVFDVCGNHINVLAHGDLWTNNILVKYDKTNTKPLDVTIIDFQYAAWGSPAIDLFYFLNSSLHPEMHFHRQEELVYYYYEIFSDTLHKMQYKAHIPSLHKFNIQLEEKAFYAFHTSCIVLPVQRNVDSTDADFNALMETNQRALNFKNTCYKNVFCHMILKQLIPEYDSKGLLDVDQSKQ